MSPLLQSRPSLSRIPSRAGICPRCLQILRKPGSFEQKAAKVSKAIVLLGSSRPGRDEPAHPVDV
jgi:hypothetical protein